MAKKNHRLLSTLLAAMILSSSMVSASAATVGAADSGAGSLSNYYSTNGTGIGKEKTITVDGDIGDWDESMKIAQGTANDDPRVYRPNSMFELPLDLYSLYGAYDDNNLYLMWEMTNVQDVVAPNDDYPLTQGILYQTMNIPFFIAIDTGMSDVIGNSGKTTKGGTIWDSGITFGDNRFNRLIAVSTNGANGPFVYKGDSSGLNPVEVYTAKTSGISFNYGKGILSKNVYGIDKAYGVNNNRVVGDMCNESAAWVDFNTKGHKSSSMDFHYEMSIPYETLGITKADVTANGVGALVIMTSGKSGMDCLPYDLSMNDQADLDDSAGSLENNSFEKSDEDNITCAFARIGNGTINPPKPIVISTDTSKKDTDSTTPVKETDTDKKDTDTQVVTDPTTITASAKKGDVVMVTLSMGAAKNVLGISNDFTYDTAKYKFVSAKGLYTGVIANNSKAGTVKWNGSFGDGSKGATFTSNTELVEIKLEALTDTNGEVGKNTVRDCYDYSFSSIDASKLVTGIAEGGKVGPIDSSDIKVTAKAAAGDTVKVTFTGDFTKFEGASCSYSYDSSALEYVGYTTSGPAVQVKQSAGKIDWNAILLDGKATDIVTFEFKALKAVDGTVGTNTAKECYDKDSKDVNMASVLTAKAVVEGKELPTPTDVLKAAEKVNVVAKKGDRVTVAFKVSGAASAAGIQEYVDFDKSALSYNGDAASSLGVINAQTSNGRVAWNLLFDLDANGKGKDLTKETEIAVMTFTALKDITASDSVVKYTIVDFYNTDNQSFTMSSNANSASAAAAAAVVRKGTGNVPVTAKQGNYVKVYCRAADAAKALGIVEQINFDKTALKYEGHEKEMGHFEAIVSDTAVRWGIMFDAKGTDLTAETDLVVLNFQALKDIASTEKVLNYTVDEFYDKDHHDFNIDGTTMVYAVSGSDGEKYAPVVDPKPDTDTKKDTDTDKGGVDIGDGSTDSDKKGQKITILFGDIDGDENITSQDAVTVLRTSTGLQILGDIESISADVNEDGEIDSGDSLSVLRVSVNLNDNSKAGQKAEITIKFK